MFAVMSPFLFLLVRPQRAKQGDASPSGFRVFKRKAERESGTSMAISREASLAIGAVVGTRGV